MNVNVTWRDLYKWEGRDREIRTYIDTTETIIDSPQPSVCVAGVEGLVAVTYSYKQRQSLTHHSPVSV